MKIEKLIVKFNFKYLWLKHVEGVDLDVHCAKCLLGEYDGRVSSRTKELYDVPLENGIYYLCGVSQPFVWSNNFHLAFQNGEGTVSVERNGICVVISGAVELPVTPDASEHINHPKIKFASYNTCRNWQFANWLKYTGIF